MNLMEMQAKLPWGIEYSELFKQNPCIHKDFQHALAHIMKAAGKLWTMIEAADHQTAVANFPKAEVEKYLADLVICALRMANTSPSGLIDLEKAVIARMETKNNVKLTETPAPFVITSVHPQDQCPTCKSELGPVLVGSYSHFPKSRFCSKCNKFLTV